jgi:chemotaxis protein CheD
MNFNRKIPSFNPAVLPMEYLPRITNVSDDKHTKHYLIPGNIFAAAQAFAITSIVGSGVALCLWDSANKIGGANHFMLPEGSEDSENSARYANIANPALLQKMLDMGSNLKTLEARIFGGSLPTVTFGGDFEPVGNRNVKAVNHFLRMQGIRLIQSEVGGLKGRKVVFQTDDGKAWSEEL